MLQRNGSSDKLQACLSNVDTWELLNNPVLMLNMSHSSRAYIILTVNTMKRNYRKHARHADCVSDGKTLCIPEDSSCTDDFNLNVK